MIKSKDGRVRKHYLYRPDANHFAGIGFSLPEDYNPNSDDPAGKEFSLPHDKWTVDVHFTDKSLAKQWEVPVVRCFEEDPQTEGDFPALNNYDQVPVMSERAWHALQPLIGYCCEALPIIHSRGGPYYIIHVMETIDCLDVDKSEFTRNAATGRVSHISRYALKEKLLVGKHIFKLPLESGADLIMDDEFRKTVEANGLKGLQFKELPMVQ
jgi:hypothetical protein